jgi:hypothetical protein
MDLVKLIDKGLEGVNFIQDFFLGGTGPWFGF